MSSLKEEMMRVHKDTDFKVNFAGVTELGEFKYTHGGSVQPGIEYHIHYTNNKEEVFMTGGVHNSSSKIIERVGDNKSLYSSYTSKKRKPKQPYPNKFTPIPTEGDYGIGNFNRYFAQKANNLNGELFEISEEDFQNQNSLFRYFKINWRISGKKIEVSGFNTVTLLNAVKNRGNTQLLKMLFPLQYWNPPKDSIDDIQSKLNRRKKM